eukprot:111597-Chlamydomonas_euryale.AAC.3
MAEKGAVARRHPRQRGRVAQTREEQKAGRRKGTEGSKAETRDGTTAHKAEKRGCAEERQAERSLSAEVQIAERREVGVAAVVALKHAERANAQRGWSREQGTRGKQEANGAFYPPRHPLVSDLGRGLIHFCRPCAGGRVACQIDQSRVTAEVGAKRRSSRFARTVAPLCLTCSCAATACRVRETASPTAAAAAAGLASKVWALGMSIAMYMRVSSALRCHTSVILAYSAMALLTCSGQDRVRSVGARGVEFEEQLGCWWQRRRQRQGVRRGGSRAIKELLAVEDFRGWRGEGKRGKGREAGAFGRVACSCRARHQRCQRARGGFLREPGATALQPLLRRERRAARRTCHAHVTPCV